jgi:ABC-2 type transport system permease protein
LKRYFRSRSRMIGSIGQPLLFLIALGYGLGPVFRRAGEGSYIEFLAPGVIAMSILFTSIFSGIEIIWDRQFGFLKETMAAPVSRFAIMIGRTLGGATVATAQGTVVFLISLAAGFRPAHIELLPAVLMIMILIALLFTALGTAVASRLEDMQGFQLIMNFFIMPLFFLSGALFPLRGLPPVLKKMTVINPLSYGVDALRGLLTGPYYFGLIIDCAVLGGVALFFLLLGSYLFSRIEM